MFEYTTIRDTINEVASWNRAANQARYQSYEMKDWPIDEVMLNKLHSIYASENNEYLNATSINLLVDGIIDIVWTRSWHDLMGLVHEGLSYKAALDYVLHDKEAWNRLFYEARILDRMGVNVTACFLAINEDNWTKFTTFDDATNSVGYYKHVVGEEAEARYAGNDSWAVIRLSDLKVLKPCTYLDRVSMGKGLNLDQYIPTAAQVIKLRGTE